VRAEAIGGFVIFVAAGPVVRTARLVNEKADGVLLVLLERG
jgi:hypothetical protein